MQIEQAAILLEDIVAWLNQKATEDLFGEIISVELSPIQPDVLLFTTVFGTLEVLVTV